MREQDDRLGVTRSAIRAASSVAERQFLEVGTNLERAAQLLDRLTETFRKLVADLDSVELEAATTKLSEAAAKVAALAGAHRSDHAALARLAALSAAMDERALRIRKAIRMIGILGTNARIAAAHLGAAGVDFANFTDEIGRSLKVAETNLDRFSAQVAAVRAQLQASQAGEREFEATHGETMRIVPERLGRSVTAIAGRRQAATQAAGEVGERTAQVRRRVGSAVMALQIGDITRQRLEHVDHALAVADEIAAGAAVAGLSDDGRQLLAAECWRLQAAQLADTIEEFKRQLGEIAAALNGLVADARQIFALGASACGGSTDGRGVFLLELEEDVSSARRLLAGFRAARDEADKVADWVSQASMGLAGHLRTVSSLEADIRIMGLNTSLKCSRLGDRGRTLGVIAQELRACANHTAEEAGVIMGGLDDVVAASAELSTTANGGITAEIGAIDAILTDAVARLSAAGESLAAALTLLERDGDAVAGLLETTIARLDSHREICDRLQGAVAALEGLSASRPAPGEDIAEAKNEMLARLARAYTMDREREVHERIGHGRAPTPAASPPPKDAVLEDVLF